MNQRILIASTVFLLAALTLASCGLNEPTYRDVANPDGTVTAVELPPALDAAGEAVVDTIAAQGFSQAALIAAALKAGAIILGGLIGTRGRVRSERWVDV